MLLVDVSESYRETTMKKFKLDPAHFMTAHGLDWGACLKMTGVKQELMTDQDMSLLIDRGLICGVSAILHPYAKANNPKCKDFDKEKPTSWIKYLNANNLYGW